ncbi:MAG: hypothetical protein KDC52_19750, partial [Ignavibacteriae bacterium]|nr:hypothetical protein [Ignavibacteriota bacterium]
MKISLNGNIYEIARINDKDKEVELNFQNTQEVGLYRIPKDITLSNTKDLANVRNQETIKFTYSVNYLLADIKVSINKFIEEKSAITTTFTPRSAFYEKKKVLVLAYQITNQNITDEVRLTYQFLFYEVIKLIFPKTFHLLAVKVQTKNPREDYQGLNAEINENELKIFLMETTELNFNLVNTLAIEDNINRVHFIMHDWLIWNANRPKNDKDNDQKMDYSGLLEVLNTLVNDWNDLTNTRQNFYSKIETNQIFHFCDFCANPLPLNQYEILSDGRERCEDCRNRSIEHNENLDYKEIIPNAIRYLERVYDIKINSTNLKVNIVNTDAIAEKLNQGFVPTPSYDPRAIG